jgi:hypothetical protein
MAYDGAGLAPTVQFTPRVAGQMPADSFDRRIVMSSIPQTSLKSFEHIARTGGLGSLLIGGLLIAFWLGGHGALYGAYRITQTHAAPTLVAEAN